MIHDCQPQNIDRGEETEAWSDGLTCLRFSRRWEELRAEPVWARGA